MICSLQRKLKVLQLLDVCPVALPVLKSVVVVSTACDHVEVSIVSGINKAVCFINPPRPIAIRLPSKGSGFPIPANGSRRADPASTAKLARIRRALSFRTTVKAQTSL
jgi:hypothetical protein